MQLKQLLKFMSNLHNIYIFGHLGAVQRAVITTSIYQHFITYQQTVACFHVLLNQSNISR